MWCLFSSSPSCSLSSSVFAAAEEDEVKDLSVQARIRQLHWITPEHLEASIKLDVPEVASAIEAAQEELITMDAKRAPQDKLACVVACSKSVFDILSKSAGEGVRAAPRWAPSLVRGRLFCFLPESSVLYSSRFFLSLSLSLSLSARTRPLPAQTTFSRRSFTSSSRPTRRCSIRTWRYGASCRVAWHRFSCLAKAPVQALTPRHPVTQFINRFCNPDRLMAGEAGYYYTNLMGAASFVENLNAEQVQARTCACEP